VPPAVSSAIATNTTANIATGAPHGTDVRGSNASSGSPRHHRATSVIHVTALAVTTTTAIAASQGSFGG
jgi:hypothetical protein